MNRQLNPSIIRKHITSADGKKSSGLEIKIPDQNTVRRLNDKKVSGNNKENIIAIENIQPSLRQNKSPKGIKNGLKQLKIRSPQRPVYMPSGFRSNKAIQCIVDNINNQLNNKVNEEQIIFSGISKDGKYQIISKALSGYKLQNARIHEQKTNSYYNQTKKQPSSQTTLLVNLPSIDPSKTSTKQTNLIVKSYAVNTHQGISRNYNEDRVSIILNINKNNVKATFFAIYDGHGGAGCCDFLRDYLHQYIINHQAFPENPKRAIVQGIHRVENKFLELAKKKFMKTNQLDKSGSCAIIVMIVGKECYVANVGDSRAFLSKNHGKIISHLSRDHKPMDEKQQKRIIQHGGKVYRTEMTRIDKLNVQDKSQLNQHEYIVGPLRVFPGKLSVTRTFGDIQAKDPDFQGIPNCISVQPEIAKFNIDRSDDFLFLGCDGIFQKLQSIQVNKLIWKTIKQNPHENIHRITGKCVEEVIKQSMKRKSTDNLTGIMINLKEYYFQTSNINGGGTLIKNFSCRSL